MIVGLFWHGHVSLYTTVANQVHIFMCFLLKLRTGDVFFVRLHKSPFQTSHRVELTCIVCMWRGLEEVGSSSPNHFPASSRGLFGGRLDWICLYIAFFTWLQILNFFRIYLTPNECKNLHQSNEDQDLWLRATLSTPPFYRASLYPT